MEVTRQRQLFIRFTASMSLVVWMAAFFYCSSLCLLNCSPLAQDAEIEYTHAGCEGHPSDSDVPGCKDPFCDAAQTAYVSFVQFTFPKLVLPTIPEVPTPELREMPASEFIARQPPDTISLLTPVVSLATANQSHAPPVLLLT